MEPGDRLLKKPVYPGGRKAMSLFIKDNLVYPNEALKKKIDGLVIVRIDIDGNGNVIRTKLKKKLGHGCDEEAIRIVKLLKFYVTNKRKARVTFHKKIKIHFNLPKPVKKVEPTTGETILKSTPDFDIVYTYIPSKK